MPEEADMIVRALLMIPMLAAVLFASPAAAGEVFAGNYNPGFGDPGIRLVHRYGMDR